MHESSTLFSRFMPRGIKNGPREQRVRGLYLIVMLLVYVLFGSGVWAEQSPERTGPDFFVKSFLTMPGLSMSVNGQEIDPVWLDPSRIWSVGMGAEWKGVSGSFSVKTPIQTSDARYVRETRYFDIQAQFYGKRLGMDSFVQSYKGFFFRDLPLYCVHGEPCALRSDLHIQHAGLVVYYVFDPRWSMKASFSPPGRQIKSAGSWFVSGGFNLLSLSNKGPLVDGLNPAINGGRFYMASVAPGYGYTWVRERWFITTALYMGGGPMYASYSTVEQAAASKTEWKLALKAGAKLGTGYSGDLWQTGIRIHADSPVVRIGGLDLQWIAQSIELYAGRQF